MGRMLRLPGWPGRRQERSNIHTQESPVALEDHDRPEIGRGFKTSFRRFRLVDAYELIQWGTHGDPLLDSYNMELSTRSEAQRWFHSRQAWVDSQLYAVDSIEERRVVGYISLRCINLNERSSVLGISFD